MRTQFLKKVPVSGLLGALALAGASSAFAGQRTWDFSTDPTTGTDPLVISGNGVNPGEYQASGGNPGGFLAVTWPVNGQVTSILFPNIDPGKVVTSFQFSADLRVGNSRGDRAADGFSVSFARDGDPVLDEANAGQMAPFAGGIMEGGTTTGIAVCFDTWSGNTLPDGADIEGLIVRVDTTRRSTGLRSRPVTAPATTPPPSRPVPATPSSGPTAARPPIRPAGPSCAGSRSPSTSPRPAS